MTAAGLSGRCRGFHRTPGFLPCRRDRAAAGHEAWGRAVRRCQAVTIASAHGQVVAIFRRRAPRTSRAAAWKIRYRRVLGSALARSLSRAISSSQAIRQAAISAAANQALFIASACENLP